MEWNAVKWIICSTLPFLVKSPQTFVEKETAKCCRLSQSTMNYGKMLQMLLQNPTKCCKILSGKYLFAIQLISKGWPTFFKRRFFCINKVQSENLLWTTLFLLKTLWKHRSFSLLNVLSNSLWWWFQIWQFSQGLMILNGDFFALVLVDDQIYYRWASTNGTYLSFKSN